MPARMDGDYNVMLPRGETFGFLLHNYGTLRFGPGDSVRMVVRTKEGTQILTKTADLLGDTIRFLLEPSDTSALEEGTYLWDVIIETAETSEAHALRKTLFAPRLRKFIIGGIADGQAW